MIFHACYSQMSLRKKVRTRDSFRLYHMLRLEAHTYAEEDRKEIDLVVSL